MDRVGVSMWFGVLVSILVTWFWDIGDSASIVLKGGSDKVHGVPLGRLW